MRYIAGVVLMLELAVLMAVPAARPGAHRVGGPVPPPRYSGSDAPTAMAIDQNDRFPRDESYVLFAELAERYPHRPIVRRPFLGGFLYTVTVDGALIRYPIRVWSLAALAAVLADLDRPDPSRVRPYVLAAELVRAARDVADAEERGRLIADQARAFAEAGAGR
ncbi:hypothetical protein ACFO4E_24550 [Nocardiopsis mangrovi]|uniref:Uncharacterized protein n=1 Tax=Nocardiopsis mangrovi TaxID=1179818 RepID=A0ABV9E4E1_9ACTN